MADARGSGGDELSGLPPVSRAAARISATSFFRDPEVFEALESIVPSIFRNKGPNDTIRVWVPACATGEEAYSVAMLLAEHAQSLDEPPTIQLFGSDLDASAIQVARAALYPATISADVSEERLRRFFHKEARAYRIRRELRERTAFATHDLLNDAPFSRMDIVACRNVLTCLSREAQRRATDILHFALRPGGTLVLGTSESIDEGSSLFEPIDEQHRIYRQVPSSRPNLPIPTRASTWPRSVRQHGAEAAPVPSARALGQRPAGTEHTSSRATEDPSPSELHLRLLEQVMPASVVVDAEYDLVHSSSSLREYLQFSNDEPSTNLLRVVHPDLRTELRTALFQAVESRQPVEVRSLLVADDSSRKQVRIRVIPAREVLPGHLLVLFEKEPSNHRTLEATQAEATHPTVAHLLERQLEHVKARLRDNLEQYEASNEELRASNEELQAMNDELRRATEELGKTNSDLHNLMASTAIPTIFLDRELRIMRYTPSALDLFRIIASDIGRPLTDLRHKLDYPELHEDARRVLDRLVPLEREVRSEREHLLARILPYRTVEGRTAGVVLTFVNITSSKRAEAALRESQDRLQLIVENARDYAIFSLDLKRRVTSWNSGATAILGYTPEEALGQSGDIVFTPEDRAAGLPEQEAERALSHGRATDERWHIRKDGTRFWGSGALMPMHDAHERAIGFVKVFRDETDERQAKEALESSRQELMVALREMERARAEAEAAGRAKDHFLAVLSHELRTPLTPVLMAARALSKCKDMPAAAAEPLAMIERNVQLEAQFIDDLLDVTRIAHGKLEVSSEHVDLHEVIRRAVEVSRPDIDAKDQELQVELLAQNSEVQGDPRRLQQVFWNLLKNACKFTPGRGSIRVTTWSDGRSITAEVTDSGTGFDAEVSERIFSAFEQANDTISRQFGGLGLGLAIAKATVEAHRGTIRARSDGPGKGATFTVQLTLTAEVTTNDRS